MQRILIEIWSFLKNVQRTIQEDKIWSIFNRS